MALRKLPTLVSEKPSPALIFSAFVPVPVRVSSVTVILRGALEHVLWSVSESTQRYQGPT